MSEPKTPPAWARTFTFEELPEEYRERFARFGKFVEPETGTGPYARNLEDVIETYLQWLNSPGNPRRVRDEERVDPSGSVEQKTQRVIEARLRDAWLHLRGPYERTYLKFNESEKEAWKARHDAENPWTGRPGWETEASLPIHMQSRRRQGEDVEEAEEPGYLVYNQLVANEHYRPFRTSAGDPRVALPGSFGLEVYDPLSQGGDLSREFLRKIGYSLFTVKGRAVPGRELAVAIGALVGRAASRELPRERVVELAIRVAPILPIGSRLDLADDRHRCVVLGPGSWRVEEIGHPVFDSRRHMLALPEPQHVAVDAGWSRVGELWRFVSIVPRTGPDDPALLATALLVQFLLYPSSPKPVTIISGDEGSGKTSAATRLGSVVDPSLVPIVRPPGDDDSLLNLAMNHAVINIDNVSYIKHELSDDLARLSTGIGLPKRRLFTDNDEIIANAKPLVILNGITATPSAADLLRRAVFLPIVQPSMVRPQVELDAEWREAHPRILGGLLDLAARAAEVLSSGAELVALSSMADYVRVGQAVAIAQGRTREDFLAAWDANVERQGVAAAENPWVTVLYDYFTQQPIDGEPKRADSIAAYINEFDRVTFPKGVTGQHVGNSIARVKKTLARMGIHVARRTIHGIPVYRRVSEPDGAQGPPIEAFDVGSPAPNDVSTVGEGGGPNPEKGFTQFTQGHSSGSELQGSREVDLSLQTPGVNLGPTPHSGSPKLGPTSGGGSHPGSPRGSPSDSPPTGPVQGEPGEPKSTKRGDPTSSSSHAGPGNLSLPQATSDTVSRAAPNGSRQGEWASPRCEGCPDCKPPHDDPLACTCTRCDPFGVPTGSSGTRLRSHYCGILQERSPP